MKTLVVLGLGPVGLTLAVSAGLHHPGSRIIGLDKNQNLVNLLNTCKGYLKTKDKDFHLLLNAAILEKKIQITSNMEWLSETDVVVLALGPIVVNEQIDYESFLMALDEIVNRARPDTLLIIASTLPIGTMQGILPKLSKLRVAYAFERITPGENMLSSAGEGIKIIAAKDTKSYEATRDFFQFDESIFISFEEAEMTKLLENSYRASNIALIHEWTLLAESTGVNLFSIIDSIRLRVGTHDNIRAPGPGIGGPCLLKDSMISILNNHMVDMPFLKLAMKTSEAMNNHIVDLVGEVDLLGVLGLSYRSDVSDIRNSPSVNVISKVLATKTYVYDPLVSEVEDYPQINLITSFEDFIDRVNVLLVFHFLTDEMMSLLISKKRKMKIIDTCNMISDVLAEELHLGGAKLVGVGKGHWRSRGYDQ